MQHSKQAPYKTRPLFNPRQQALHKELDLCHPSKFYKNLYEMVIIVPFYR